MAKRTRRTRYRRAVAPRVRRVYARARAYRRRGSRGLGGRSWIKHAIGAIGLVIANRYQPLDYGYKSEIDMIATGAILKVLKQDNMDLVTAGIKSAAAKLINSYLGGGLTAASTGGGESI